MSDVTIELREVSREFINKGEPTVVSLSDINLTLHKGEIKALVGRSGSGKTTLLQIAGLLDAPSRGQVILQGEDMTKAPNAKRTVFRRDGIGFVYQFHHLMKEFSAVENVMMPQLIRGDSQKKAREQASHLLEKVGLKDRLEHRPGQLSGGEQQRVAIARAIVNKPALILADEPTGNLDPLTADQVFDYLVELVQSMELSMLVVTHSHTLVERIGSVVRLHDGMLQG